MSIYHLEGYSFIANAANELVQLIIFHVVGYHVSNQHVARDHRAIITILWPVIYERFSFRPEKIPI